MSWLSQAKLPNPSSHAAESSHCAPNDVFALHHDESPSSEELSSPLDSPDGTALNIDIFCPRSDDEQPGISQNDQAFLDIMHQGVTVTSDGYILLPMTLLVSSHLSSLLGNSFRGKYFPLKNLVVNL